ncbi:MAG: MFS transporter [Armatimonadota bacterium]
MPAAGGPEPQSENRFDVTDEPLPAVTLDELKPSRWAALGSLRYPEFALFWGGQVVSLVGTWMQAFAQGWVITTLTASPLALGMVSFASSIPTLLFMPLGGVAADRMDRRRILLMTQWLMMLLAFLMGWLLATKQLQLWHLFGIALMLGVVTAYELPAFQAFYPQLIPRSELPRAIPLNQAAFHGARIVGPAVGSWLVARWGSHTAFFANAASFLAVVAALALIRPRPPVPGSQETSVRTMLREGVDYVRERPGLQALLALVGLTTFCIFPNLAVLSPHYAREVLHVGAGGLGIMMSVSGAGALLGAVLLLTLGPGGRLPRIAASVVVGFVALSIMAWSRSLWLSVAAMTLQSFALSQSMGIISIMVQEMVPDELRGRVMSLYTLMFTGIMPFGALAIPGLAQAIGMRLELQIAAVVFLLLGVYFAYRLYRATDLETAVPTVSEEAG